MTWPISSSSSDDANPRPTYDPCPALTPPSPSTTCPRPPIPAPYMPPAAALYVPLLPPFSHRDPPPPPAHALTATHPSPVLAAHEHTAWPRLPVFFWGKAISTARTVSSRHTQAVLACRSHSHGEAPPHPRRSRRLTLVRGSFLYGKVCTKLHT